MSWGAPLGFSSGKSPLEMANTASAGDPEFELHYKALPTEEHPNRARVTFPTGRATFNNTDDAWMYLTTEQSTTIQIAAAYYLGHQQQKDQI